MDADLEARARAWLATDPDPATRAELTALLDAGDEAAVADRFRASLGFGTAGIRGPLGAGPHRMNVVTARRAAAGIAAWLRGAGRPGPVVAGRDARHRSPDLLREAAGVLAGAGLEVVVLPAAVPTPVLAFAVRHLGCAAGVMVTASHNPPADNGIKVYAGDGAQVIPPADGEIAAAMGAVAEPHRLPLGEPRRAGAEVEEAYLDAAAGVVGAGPRQLRLVHTALHGVATEPLARLFRRAGFEPPVTVAAQAEPDPDFPTVAFPNPEEPGALDLAVAEAERVDADAVVANDPDGDRLAVAVPDGGRWRALTGDELGALLADHLLATTTGGDRLVVSSIVSSTLLGRLAAEHGARWATTLTGFKWIVRATDAHPGTRFLFGYEEALGYAVSDVVRDKDGLTAALVFADLAARLRAEGATVADRLADIARRHGLHATRQWSVRLEGEAGAAAIAGAVEQLAASPPATLAARPVTGVDQPAPDVVVLHLAGDARAVVRPSGTEPKLKVYLQVVVPAGDDHRAAAELEALRQAVAAALRLPQ